MVRALICTLGFDTDPVVRRIVGSRLEEGGVLLLLTAKPLRPETESAINDIKGLVSAAYGSSVKVEVKAINLHSFHEAVSEVRKELERFKHDDIVLNLSGGMRALVLSTYTAYLISGLDKAKLVIDLEGRQGTVELPCMASLLTTPPQLTEEKLKILALLKEPKTPHELSELLDKDLTTIYRHLRDLEDLKLIERENRMVRLSSLGRMLV